MKGKNKEEDKEEEEEEEDKDNEVQESEGGLGKDEESKRKILGISSTIAQQIIEALKPTPEEIKTELRTLSAALNQNEDERNSNGHTIGGENK